MLKALELCGFKSFADKTRFEFPSGITVVVGPNGSGKSNIVDAIKWVLGEQSAKSLRGREMADVIFKGSGGARATRRPANTAEATIFFENDDRLLPIDSDEIRVTRRVFRSGEGEYLINGNACRLRDVKDLFRGTGVGTDAYSLIEQGKVDTLLQASARERRAIFEEAAGISRFKAKKVETQRRLERVEQNLTRLADIVDEVESRLRSVRNQASKARRFKEYTDRLKQLRTHVGWTDWRVFSQRLGTLEERIGSVCLQLETNQRTLTEAEAKQRQIDQSAEQLASELHQVESQISDFRQQLSGHESTCEHERQRLADQEHEIGRYRRQWLSMTARAGDLGAQLHVIQSDLQNAEQTYATIRGRLDENESQRKDTVQRLGELRLGRDEQRETHARLLRESADLGRQISVLDAEIQATSESLERGLAKEEALSNRRQVAGSAKDDHERAEAELDQNERARRESLNKARRALHSREHQLSLRQQELVDLQQRYAVANERASVLQDLQRRHEGLGPGVKDVLSRSQDGEIGPLANVCGLVADLIRVEVGMAPLIDVALGELTQFVVVDGPVLGAEIASGNVALKGRVGLLDLTGPFQGDEDTPNLNSQRCVIGRADAFVEVDDRFKPLVRHLLCATWCVETLSDALRLRQEFEGRLRFISRTGDLVECDGRMLAGPRQSGSGLVSRRSELRSLQHELVELEARIQDTEAVVSKLKDEIDVAEDDVERESTGYDQIAAALAEARMQSHAARDRLATLDDQLESLQAELESARTKKESAQTQQQAKSADMQRVTTEVSNVEARLTTQQQQMDELEALSEEQTSKVTSIRVELAKSEQRLDDLRGQRLRYEEDQRERARALEEVKTQLQQARQRHSHATRIVLNSTSAIAELYLAVEQCQHHIERLVTQRQLVSQQRTELHEQTQQLRRAQQQLDEQRHGAELEANQVKLEREALAQRVRDDYEIDLADVTDDHQFESDDEKREREEIDQEIGALRRKISNIGAVNMAALEEIESLEERHDSLATQFQDLTDAKNSLARIIHRINADSRRLFTESLEMIRANFQSLFRRVFGGGHADIVLEEDVDILEAGIDIIATPPGKHSLGISLLSGGERALTAVTLLLAIFQYRPSPFCVLDEVDGPLDEANIGRFIDVLNEFLQWTKFVVVTHSKKTMTAATTLYGVTMQESGVSKQVSVQFDDVSEDGQISHDAVQRTSDSDDFPPSGPEDDETGGDERGAA